MRPKEEAMRKLILCGILLLGAALSAAAPPPTMSPVGKVKPVTIPRLIEPGSRLGPVTAASTLESLRAQVGAHLVTLEPVQSEDGKSHQMGTVIYGGDPKKRIELAWGDTLTKARPLWARVRNAANYWHTTAGVHIGTTLAELEKLNGRAFTVTSFRGGERRSQVRSWNKGILANELERDARIWLAVPASTTKAQMTPLSQGSLLPSGDPPLRHINPYVTEITIRFVTSS
jgi:hypothetical protein